MHLLHWAHTLCVAWLSISCQAESNWRLSSSSSLSSARAMVSLAARSISTARWNSWVAFWASTWAWKLRREDSSLNPMTYKLISQHHDSLKIPFLVNNSNQQVGLMSVHTWYECSSPFALLALCVLWPTFFLITAKWGTEEIRHCTYTHSPFLNSTDKPMLCHHGNLTHCQWALIAHSHSQWEDYSHCTGHIWTPHSALTGLTLRSEYWMKTKITVAPTRR